MLGRKIRGLALAIVVAFFLFSCASKIEDGETKALLSPGEKANGDKEAREAPKPKEEEERNERKPPERKEEKGGHGSEKPPFYKRAWSYVTDKFRPVKDEEEKKH